MVSAVLISQIPVLTGVDRWVELFSLLPVLVALELILSADNAIALAAVARQQNDPRKEKQALDLGIGIAFLLRIALIFLAQWVLASRTMRLFAGIYLLWLFISHTWLRTSAGQSDLHSASVPPHVSFTKTIFTLAFTDFAFSVDSVAAAIAISDELYLILAGAFIGVVSLRFTSGLFIHWLAEFTRLESAGYLAVAFVGLKIIFTSIFSFLDPPEWWTLVVVTILMIWGFSRRKGSVSGDLS